MVSGTILRLPCMKYAEFNVIHTRKALKGYLLQRDRNTTDVQCMKKCIEHAQCRSYNINRGLKVCELNSKAFPYDATSQLEDELNWMYKSTNFEERLVSVFCSF